MAAIGQQIDFNVYSLPFSRHVPCGILPACSCCRLLSILAIVGVLTAPMVTPLSAAPMDDASMTAMTEMASMPACHAALTKNPPGQIVQSPAPWPSCVWQSAFLQHLLSLPPYRPVLLWPLRRCRRMISGGTFCWIHLRLNLPEPDSSAARPEPYPPHGQRSRDEAAWLDRKIQPLASAPARLNDEFRNFGQ